jgi:hypothetical protein
MSDNRVEHTNGGKVDGADWFSVVLGMVAYFLLGWMLFLIFFDSSQANITTDGPIQGLSKIKDFFVGLQNVSFLMIGIGVITAIILSLKGYKNLRNGIWIGVVLTIVLLLFLKK